MPAVNIKKIKPGFTIIELSLVIGIIAVLAGVTTSILNSGRNQDRASDASRIANLQKTCDLIASIREIEGAFPDAGDTNNPLDVTGSIAATYIQVWPEGFLYDTDGNVFSVYVENANANAYKCSNAWGGIRECDLTSAGTDIASCTLVSQECLGEGCVENIFCNGNGVCDVGTENYINCPSECPQPVAVDIDPVTPPPSPGGSNIIPTASFNYTLNNSNFGVVNFDGTVSQNASYYSWSFEGGGSSTSAAPTHDYFITQTDTDQIRWAELTVTSTTGDTNTLRRNVTFPAASPNSPPVAYIVSPSNNFKIFVNQSITFDGTGSDIDGDTLSYLWNFGDSNTSASKTDSHFYTTPGTYQVSLTVSDGTASDTAYVIVDVFDNSSCIEDQVQLQTNYGPTGSGQYALNQTFTPGISGLLDRVQVSVGSQYSGLVYIQDLSGSTLATHSSSTLTGSWQEFVFNTPATLQAGTVYRIKFAQNPSYYYAGTSWNDVYTRGSLNGGVWDVGFKTCMSSSTGTTNKPPTANITAPTGSSFGVNEMITFTGTGSDPEGSTVTFSWNMGDGKSYTGDNIKHAYTQTGDKTVTLYVSDGTNTTSVTKSITITGVNSPPTASITAPTGNTFYAGESISFVASASDPDGDPLTYTWNMGDGNLKSGSNISHSYSLSNDYTVTLSVSDGVNTTTVTKSISIIPPANSPPSASIIAPTGNTFYVGDVITFTASASDPDGDKLTYSWKLGDESIKSGSSITHTYTYAQTPIVILTVSDGVNSVNVYKELSILNPPEESLDQQNLTAGSLWCDQAWMWQSFTAGKTGMLSKISIKIGPGVTEGVLYIRSGAGSTGKVLAEQPATFSGINGWKDFVFSNPTTVTTGNIYTIHYVSKSGCASYYFGGGNPYPGGTSNGLTNYDDGFKTYVTN